MDQTLHFRGVWGVFATVLGGLTRERVKVGLYGWAWRSKMLLVFMDLGGFFYT